MAFGRTTVTTLFLLAGGTFISGCAMQQENKAPTVVNSRATLVTPWGDSSSTGASATGQQTTNAQPNSAFGSSAQSSPDSSGGMVANQAKNPPPNMQSHPANTLVVGEDHSKKMISSKQKEQIDEAKIALGILDRMAQRCVNEKDSAACNTLEKNWFSLSKQLHKSLALFDGKEFVIVPGDDTPIASEPAGTPPSLPQPSSEKSIPMVSPETAQ